VTVGVGARGVLDLLPNRYPMLMIDTVELLIPFERARARKNVSVNERVCAVYPMVRFPPVLLIEAMAQVASLVVVEPGLALATEIVLAGIDGAVFGEPVIPGDTLTIEAVLKKLRGPLGVVHGRVNVGTETRCEATISLGILGRTGHSSAGMVD
jgi:3-hydroxyacyl-[acyl-carrier-protein] dehydratase